MSAGYRTTIVLAGLLALVAEGCFQDKLEPVAPTWDLDVTLPLANRTYTLLDAVRKDPEALHQGAGNVITYSTEQQAPATTVGDAITLQPTASTHEIRVGVFGLSDVTLTSPVQIPGLTPGSTTTIPDFTTSLPDAGDTVATFVTATFESGTASLTFVNNLPVPVAVLDPVVMRDSRGQLAVFDFGGRTIAAGGGSARASSNLAGKTMDHAVRFTGLRVHVFPSSGPVTIPATPLQSTFALTALRARRAVIAEIPAQRLTDNDSTRLDLTDSTIVKELVVRSGNLSLTFENTVPLDMMLHFRFTEILRRSGSALVPYADSLFVPRGGTSTRAVSLAGTTILSADGDLIRSLQVVSSLVLPGSTSTMNLADTDAVIVTLIPGSQIVAESAVGVLKPTRIAVRSSVPLHLGELPSKVTAHWVISRASLALRTLSTIGFPMDLNVRLSAVNPLTGTPLFLDVPPGQMRLQPGVDSIVFDPAAVGSFLSQFSQRFPDSIRIEGSVLVNPPDVYTPTLGGVGTVTRTSFVDGTVALDVPLDIGITNATYRDTVVIGDTAGNGYQDYPVKRDEIKNVTIGTVYAEVLNATPVELDIAVNLLDLQRRSILLVPQAGALPIRVTAASVGPDGTVSVPAHASAVIHLDSREVRAFDVAQYVTTSVRFSTTSGASTVKLRTSDSVHVRLWTQLSLRTNP